MKVTFVVTSSTKTSTSPMLVVEAGFASANASTTDASTAIVREAPGAKLALTGTVVVAPPAVTVTRSTTFMACCVRFCSVANLSWSDTVTGPLSGGPTTLPSMASAASMAVPSGSVKVMPPCTPLPLIIAVSRAAPARGVDSVTLTASTTVRACGVSSPPGTAQA